MSTQEDFENHIAKQLRLEAVPKDVLAVQVFAMNESLEYVDKKLQLKWGEWEAACKLAAQEQREWGAQQCREYKLRVSEQLHKIMEQSPEAKDLLNRLEGKEMGADTCEHLVLCDASNCEYCAEAIRNQEDK